MHLYTGLDGDQALQLVASSLNDADRKQILEKQADLYLSHYIQDVRPFGRIRDVFTSLKYSGGRIALATDCRGPQLQHYLSLLNINDLIDCMACGDDADHGKPDPRLVGRALRKLGTTPAQSVMVGDTPYDAEAAREAGTSAAGVLTGGFSQTVLKEAECFAVASDITSLRPYLLRGPSKPDAHLSALPPVFVGMKN